MKKVKDLSSALIDIKANSQVESKDSQILDGTSINDVSANSNKIDVNINGADDDDPWKWGTNWDRYTEEIVERCDYLRALNIPKIEFVVGLIIHHFVEVLEERPKCKYIDLRGLAFDHRAYSEPKRPITYYSVEETSKLTGRTEREISTGISQGYFLCEKINGKCLFTDAHIQFIISFAQYFIEFEKL